MSDLLGNVPTEALDRIGVVALIVLFAISLAREWLVVGPTHRREMAARDTEYERMVTLKDGTIERLKGEKDDWRDAYRASDARGDVLAEQVRDLVAEQRTFNRFMESLTNVVNRGGQP